MTKREFLGLVISKLPDEPRPVNYGPAQALAELTYDPALAENDVEQLQAAARAFDRAADQFIRLSDRLSRLARSRNGENQD